jgi:hypothetical protein
MLYFGASFLISVFSRISASASERVAVDLHRRHLLQHQRNARAVAGLLEVRRNPLLQVLRLADIEHRRMRVEHAIHARRLGQGREEFPAVESRNDVSGGRRAVKLRMLWKTF